jgi:stalled ribosome rescue protein Dom34
MHEEYEEMGKNKWFDFFKKEISIKGKISVYPDEVGYYALLEFAKLNNLNLEKDRDKYGLVSVFKTINILSQEEYINILFSNEER